MSASPETPEPVVLSGTAGLRAAVGTTFGPSPEVTVSADRVDAFMRATGAPPEDLDGVAPSNLVLALTNLLLPQLVRVDDIRMGVNYGTDSVRFPATTPVGAAVRASVELVGVDDVAGGVQTRMRITVAGAAAGPDDEPFCVVDSLSRFFD